MRLSSDPRHPDYMPGMWHATVCLEGCIVDHCLHADEEAGEVTVAEVDAKGNVRYIGSTLATKVLRGHVRIYLPAKA